MSRVRKKSWRSAVSVILVVAIALGVCGAIVSFARSDTKMIGVTAFTRGALNEADGTYVKGKTSIVTEDLFECKGLKVIPDFDNTSQYQVFWYNEDEIYLGATDKMGASTKTVGSVPGAAVYARVVIYPQQVDEDGKAIKDFEIKLWEISKYKKSIKIEVARDQAALLQNLMVSTTVYDEDYGTKAQALVNFKSMYFKGYALQSEATFSKEELDENLTVDVRYDCLFIDCSNVAVFKVDLTNTEEDVWVHIYDVEGKRVNQFDCFGGNEYLVEVPESSTNAMFRIVLKLESGANIKISEYLYRELL